MNFKAPHILLGALLAAWLLLAAPPLWNQLSRTAQARSLLAGKGADQRTALVDTPGYPIARELAQSVPPEGCIVVLAFAGPAAIDYYQSRFNYYLYPRRVHVFDDTSAQVESCGYLAVFRDSEQNLANEPFAGSWAQAELTRRLRGLQRIPAGGRVELYRTP